MIAWNNNRWCEVNGGTGIQDKCMDGLSSLCEIMLRDMSLSSYFNVGVVLGCFILMWGLEWGEVV